MSLWLARSLPPLHPDGRTVFVSVRRDCYGKQEREMCKKSAEDLRLKWDEEEEERQAMKQGTFSLDTETGDWTRQGDWLLPFKGEARYDDSLDAWVGTRMVRDSEDGREYEHLCSCDVPDIDDGPTEEALAWKVDEDELTFLEETPGDQRVLLHTGSGMFCLVESALRDGVSYGRRLGGGDKWLLHVTIFRAKYGKNGELLAEPITPGRSYLMSRYLNHFHASAFWI